MTMLAIGSSAAYYVFKYLPDKDAREERTARDRECSAQSAAAFHQFTAEKKTLDRDATFTLNGNHYNQKLRKCFLSLTSESGPFSDDYLLDGFEHTVLLTCHLNSASSSHERECFDYDDLSQEADTVRERWRKLMEE